MAQRSKAGQVLAEVVGADQGLVANAAAQAAKQAPNEHPWNDAVSILLCIDPQNPALAAVRDQLTVVRHPADPFVLWLFDAASGKDAGAFPRAAYRQLIGHPQVNLILDRMSQQRKALAPLAVAWRDPGLLQGQFHAGLELLNESWTADPLLRLLGILDAIELRLWKP